MDREYIRLQVIQAWMRPDSIQEVRRWLEQLPPYHVLRLLADEFLTSTRHSQVSAHFQQFSSKRQLLAWVYGRKGEPDARLLDYTEWQNLPRHSRSKTMLVDQICSDVRRKHSWMTPQIVHAFAFRQTFFAKRGFRYWPSAHGLYERRQIPKSGGGTRDLWVPIPPLRRIQRSLLRLCLDRAQADLPDVVTGARRRRHPADPPFGIYRNAALHLNQRFVASFDLKSFFPSVRVDDVIKTLRALSTPVCLDEDQSPLPWTHDTVVLVARLLTRRGRLPQGAPSSPAIANLVFQRFDAEILSRLGQDFVYSRYFDDITVSVSPSAARSHRIDVPQRLRSHVNSVLDSVLERSPFQINQKKTRATSIEQGHRVTGLRVTEDRVTLPRRTRRALSALLHQLKRDGLLAVATRHVDGAVLARTTFDGARGHHMKQMRRLATERLAVLMLRSICKEIRLEVPGEAWYLGGSRIVRQDELHEGKEALRDIERLLTKIWRNELRVEADNGHFVAMNSAGHTVARVRCEKNGEFFLLPRRSAIAVVEFWHRLHGWKSGLNPADRDECFAHLENLRDRITDALERIELRPLPGERKPEAPSMIESKPFSLLRDGVGEIHTIGPEVWTHYLDFYHCATGGQHPPHSVADRAPDFHAPVTTPEQLAEWLSITRNLFLDELPKLPSFGSPEASRDLHDPLDILRILDDRFRQVRCPSYLAEREFLNKHIRRSRVEEIDASIAATVQLGLLREINGMLSRSLAIKNQQSLRTWLDDLRKNPWRESIEQSLRTAYRDFNAAHEHAKWITTGEPVFAPAAQQVIAENAVSLFHSINTNSTREVWRELFSFSNALCSATVDILNGSDQTFSSEVREKLQKAMPEGRIPGRGELFEELYHEVGDARDAFDVVFLMRNRKAHPEDAGKLGEWKKIQKFAAKVLDKRLSKPGKQEGGQTLFGPADLQLTSLEGTELKLHLLRAVSAGLKRLVGGKG